MKDKTMKDKTLDCSDIDRLLGKPIEGARLKDPIGNLDIKRWVQAMHYPNRIHYSDAFAVDSRFGRIVAPQSFSVACDDGHGSAPSRVGSAQPGPCLARDALLNHLSGGTVLNGGPPGRISEVVIYPIEARPRTPL